MEAKLAKLQTATDEAKALTGRLEAELEAASRALAEEKARLRALSPEDQETMQVVDTRLPELLEAHAAAKDEYETARTRYETNERYLGLMRSKMGLSSETDGSSGGR